jgi:hypothetical protein
MAAAQVPVLESGVAPAAVVAVLLLLCLAALVLAWVTEPGILHVITHDQQTWYIHDRCTGEEHELVEFRAKFCRETGNCIENFDHFCPWVRVQAPADNFAVAGVPR